MRLLCAAVASGEKAVQNYRVWRRELVWGDIPLSWQMMLPVLHENAIRHRIEDPLLDRIAGVRRYMWARSLRLMNLAKRVHRAFSDAGVPIAALKGSALVACGFVDRSARTMLDIDGLVPIDKVERAATVFAHLKMAPVHFRLESILARIVATRAVDGWAFSTATDEHFDLHWNALHLDRRIGADENLWRRIRHATFEGEPILVPSPEDLALQIATHGAKDFGPNILRGVSDLALLLRKCETFDWSLFIKDARAHSVGAHIAPIIQLTGEITDRADAILAAAELLEQSEPFERLEAGIPVGPSSRVVGLAVKAVQLVADQRRQSDQLFDANPLSSMGPALRNAHGTQTALSALGRQAYIALNRPARFRSLLANDANLALPDTRKLLPLQVGTALSISEMPEEHFLLGWSLAEKGGRWTDGPIAVTAILLPPELGEKLKIVINATPALMPAQPRMTTTIYVNNRFCTVRTYRYGIEDPELLISIAKIGKNNLILISFEFEKNLNPLHAGISHDVRQLGLFARNIRVENNSNSNP